MTFKKKSARRNFRLATILLAGSALAGVPLAALADPVWTGAVSSDWFTAGNWIPNAVPTSADNSIVDLGVTAVIAGNAATTDELDIGVSNTAAVTVSGTGTLTTSGDIILGQNAGSSGTLTVSGGGAVTVSSFNQLDIGEAGSGTLMMNTASTLTADRIEIGDGAGGGTATLDGAGTSITVTNLDVGVGGTGTLTLQNSAVLNTTNATLGLTGGVNSSITLIGINTVTTNTDWLGSGGLDVGNGAIHVSASAAATFSGTVNIADGAGTAATLTVDGGQSEFSDTGTVNIGDGGAATVMLSNGGSLAANAFNLATGAGSSVTMDVNDGELSNNGTTNIGVDGTATVTLENGGGLGADVLDLGVNAGSHGTVSVTGTPGNIGITHAVTVGDAGTGSLSVLNSGYFTGDSLIIGAQSGSSGTVLVDGSFSQLTINTDIAVGQDNGAVGTLTVSGSATVSSNVLALGVFSGASGTATVTGTGSDFQTFSNTFIGDGGTGTLNILAGSTFEDGFITYVGEALGATGTLNVDGAGSSFSSAANLLVGGDIVDATGGTGFVNVTHGGVITSTSSLNLGASTGASGTVVIDGAGSSLTSVSAIIGDTGNGFLTISNGGTLTAPFMSIGSSLNSVGIASVTGTGSAANASTSLLIGDLGTGTLTISGGTVTTASATIASSATGIGTLNIGAASGSAAAAPGTLASPNLFFGPGTGTLNFNHTSTAYTFAAAMTGVGTINQIAGTTFLSGNSSGYTGATVITGGALHVNGSLANSVVSVATGGTLAGNGTVGNVTVASTGIVAPGNSIGTLTVNGSYNAASGSVYNAELNAAGQSDKIAVTGTATIANGAILNIIKTDAAPYVNGTQYTLLTAAGGVSGQYTLTGNVQSAFSSAALVYDANDVYLKIINSAPFTAAGGSLNEMATEGGAVTMPAAGGLYGALQSLQSFAAAQSAFDQLSGEVYASARTALVEDSRFVRDAALERLANPATDNGMVWGQVFGDWGSRNGNGNAAKLDRSDKGVIGGVDLPVAQTWRVGVLAGYTRSDLNVQARSSAGGSDNYHLGIYGGTEDGPVAIRLGASHSWHSLDVSRSVAFAGYADHLAASYNGGTNQGFGEVGYKLAYDAVSLEPFANVAYVSLNTDGFKEAGGTSALTVASDTSGTAFTTLGLRGSQGVQLGADTSITVHGSLGWRHAFGDVTPVTRNAFAGGTAFTIDGVPLANDALAINAGFDAAVRENLTLGLSYTGQYSANARDNGIKANLHWSF